MLTSELIAENLSELRRSPLSLAHVYTNLTLSSCNLENIDILGEYRFLQSVDLSANKLSDVAVLKNLPHLLTLDVSRNNLAAVLDFGASSEWSDIAPGLGSLLVQANYSGNRVRTIRDLSPHRFLRVLNLEGNSISEITGLSSLTCLEQLDLGRNRILEIKGLRGLKIKRLSLHHNRIVNLGELRDLAWLDYLDLSYNAIEDVSELGACASLRVINLKSNRIANIARLDKLRPLTLLESLSLGDNPVATMEHYRLRVVFRLEGLASLDDTVVSAAEKVHANNLHGGDSSARETIHKTHLPHEPFINHMPARPHAYGESVVGHASSSASLAKDLVSNVIGRALTSYVNQYKDDNITK